MTAVATRIESDRTASTRRGSGAGPHGPLALLCGAGAACLLFGFQGPIIATLLALAIVTVPGIFVVDRVSARGPVERFVVVIVVSITAWTAVAHVLLSLRWWHPAPVAGTLLAAATLAALAGTPRRRSDHVFPTLTIKMRIVRFGENLGTKQMVASAVALSLWAVSLPFIDTEGFGDWGLIAAVPPTFFLAYAVAIAVAVSVGLSRRTGPQRVTAAIVPLLVIIYGTMPMLFNTIRYPWAYKHVGVIRLLDETGRLHGDVDIYNNFSGFFGLAALVRGATGVDPTSYGAWTQLVAEGLILTTVWLLVRRATDSERVAHLAAVLYLITNWVGQNYFAAQTMATLLSLAVLGLSMSWFFGGATRALPWFSSSIKRIAPDVGPSADDDALLARRAVVLFAFLGLMMTHPLTPVATIGALGTAWVVGWLRDTKLVVGIGVICVGWAVRSYAYFAAQSFDLGFGGSPAANADGNLDYSDAPSAVVAVGDLTRLFSVGVWVLAVVGAILCAWAMRRTGALVVAACVPFGIPLVQSYGGEAIYRVYLYSLPLMVGFVAWGIVTRTPIERRTIAPQPTILATVICLVLGAGFLVAHFGRESINHVEESEVAMGEYVAATLADPALLAQFAGTYPAASSARYPSFQVNDTYVPQIDDLVDARGLRPTTAELDEAADDLWALDAGRPYVIVSPGMIDSINQIASLPIASTQEAVDLLTSSGRFFVRHRIGDTWLMSVTS